MLFDYAGGLLIQSNLKNRKRAREILEYGSRYSAAERFILSAQLGEVPRFGPIVAGASVVVVNHMGDIGQ